MQQALCAPSRTVLLTGRRPDTSRVWTIGPYFRDTTGRNWTTLPQFFKEHSWRSIGHGKIFHEGAASGGTPAAPIEGTPEPPPTNADGVPQLGKAVWEELARLQSKSGTLRGYDGNAKAFVGYCRAQGW